MKKKDGQIRFCIDYRVLNTVTHKDVYPLPRIDETLEALGGALLFTTLDLKAGPVADKDKDKTRFLKREGLFSVQAYSLRPRQCTRNVSEGHGLRTSGSDLANVPRLSR